MNNTKEHIYSILAEVTDPEIPVLTILDLGIVRDVICTQDNDIEIIITPTYSGCPAMDAIAFDIKLKMVEAGFKHVKITYTLSPAWTTDWMTASGKQKLNEYGIAPPINVSSRMNKLLFDEDEHIPCPHCGSTHTKLLSEFGSTACKALHQCMDCKEPFDYFKCH